VNRRAFLAAGSASAGLAWCSTSAAQTKIVRIGLLSAAPLSPAMLDALRDGFRDRGYREGQHFSLDSRWSKVSLGELPDLATQMVPNIDILITWATPATLAARGASSSIPIVMFGTADPVATGLIASLARPGGNVTGIANLGRDLMAKQVELLVAAVPELRLVGIVHNPSPTGVNLLMREGEAAVRLLGLRVEVFDARLPQEFERAFAKLGAEHRAGAVVLPDPSVIEHGRTIAELAIKLGVPTAFQRRESVVAGGLLAHGPSLTHQIRQATDYVDRIVKGAKPEDLPVEQPSRFELVVNLQTAKGPGITIPSTLLARADEVIE
jgi:ABC-type uncharacterized transport system substrate-binding protein